MAQWDIQPEGRGEIAIWATGAANHLEVKTAHRLRDGTRRGPAELYDRKLPDTQRQVQELTALL